jgi:4-amino-4-deoxy-L-arabinose transferase-like glycosyltransferase
LPGATSSAVGRARSPRQLGSARGTPPHRHAFRLFWFIFWPAAALLPAAAQWIWRERGDPAVRFCLAWLVPSFLVFEAVATKLPHYPLPVYPAVAALLGGAVAAHRLAGGWLLARAPAIFAAAGGILVAIALLVAMDRLAGGITPLAIAVAVLAVAVAAASIFVAWKAAAPAGIGSSPVAALPIHVLAFGLAAPAVAGLWLTPRIAAALARNAPCSNRARRFRRVSGGEPRLHHRHRHQGSSTARARPISSPGRLPRRPRRCRQ